MPDADHLLTLREAAAYARLNRETVRKLANDGSLPHGRAGGRRELRFRRADIDAFFGLHPLTPGPSGGVMGTRSFGSREPTVDEEDA